MRVTAFGGPEVLVAGEAPDPVAGPGQVVVEVGFVPVVFVETQLRQGRSPGPPLPTPPYVPGGGVAGTVVAVGEGVDPERIGARVVTRVLGGRLRAARHGPGRRAGPGAGRSRARRGGGPAQRRRHRAGPLRGGPGAAGGPPTEAAPGEAERRGVEFLGLEQLQGFDEETSRRWAGRALAEAAAGRLRPVVGQVFPLERAADAHAAMDDRDTVGRTLLSVSH
ncbi:hypothetical protein GCM10010406_23060 [Streptomyces thermolineatus]|uniref:Alcohol dehydrogenase-like N-terminal domain-containing protein n=2 Tax=Streptomyces thermolineatus TaxID=44033 RepID=A0ABN3LL21_9ACTN